MNDDLEFIGKLQNDEEQAWKDLVDIYYNRLLLVCGRYVRSQEQAKDLVQETFIKAKKNIDKFDTARFSSLPPWIWQIATNISLDYVRSRKHKEEQWSPPRLSESASSAFYLKIMDSHPGPRTEANNQGKSEKIHEALEQLDDIFREVICLHYMDGLTRKEIAEFVGVPENTVKSRLRIAFQKLRNLLPEELYDSF